MFGWGAFSIYCNMADEMSWQLSHLKTPRNAEQNIENIFLHAKLSSWENNGVSPEEDKQELKMSVASKWTGVRQPWVGASIGRVGF